jgi:hypothetical protein
MRQACSTHSFSSRDQLSSSPALDPVISRPVPGSRAKEGEHRVDLCGDAIDERLLAGSERHLAERVEFHPP